MKNFCFFSEAEKGWFLLGFVSLGTYRNFFHSFSKSYLIFNTMGLTVSGNIKAYKARYRGKGFAFLECFPEDKIKFSFSVSALLNFLPAIIK